jgi:AcrR family transcriptional regulator
MSTIPRPSTRERLVAATLTALDEQGYSRLRVVDVARRAGVTTGAIYGSFRTKHALVAAALWQRHPAALAAAASSSLSSAASPAAASSSLSSAASPAAASSSLSSAASPAAASLSSAPSPAAASGGPSVLQAALDLLDARGYAKLRLADVARDAGVPLVELRQAFPTKHHVAAAAIVATAPERYTAAIDDLASDQGDGSPATDGLDTPTRDRLLDAALEVLDAVGHRGARVVDIARTAGMTTGAVYAHFASKDELVDAALAKRYSNPYRSALGHAGGGSDSGGSRPAGLLGAALAVLRQDATRDHRALVDLFAIASRDPAAGRPLVDALRSRRRDIAATVEEGKAGGTIDPDLPTDGLAQAVQLLTIGNIVLHAIGADADQTNLAELEAALRHLGL